MKIVIVGCGKVGKTILESLVKENHDVTFIDKKPEVVETVSNTYDVMGICGNGTEYQTLVEAGVSSCELFVAITNSDELNMLSCFVARRMGAKYTVARIRELENTAGLGFIKKELGLSMVINPELLSARALYNILKLPSALKVETFSSGRLEMIEMLIPEASRFDGISLKELRKKFKGKFLICAVSRNDEVFIPKGNFVLKNGDKIGLIIAEQDLHDFLDFAELSQKRIKGVMIVGAGITARYLAKLLLKSHISVKIIEKDNEICQSVCEELPETAVVVHGDGMNHDLLAEEGINSTNAFIALTGRDEENVLMSFYAQNQNVPKVVCKINRNEINSISQKLGLNGILSPRKIVADVIVQYARALENSMGSQIETLYSLMDSSAEALEFKINEDFKYFNIPLKNMKFDADVLIAGIIRGSESIIPTGEDYFLPNDKVIVIATGGKRLLDFSQILSASAS